MNLVVVGGGIAGLAAAHRAIELARDRDVALDLLLLEARERVGGTIATERVDGFLIERGPDSFLSDKPWALALCRRLGLEPSLVRTDDRFRKIYVWRAGRLHPLPDGFELLVPTRLRPFLASSLFSWRGKVRMAMDLVLPRGGAGDEALGAFVRRRLGAEALERVAQPLVAGIYTADPDDLSLAATMPRFLDVERRDRSLILGLLRAARQGPAMQGGTSGARGSLFVTLADGMEGLVDGLVSRLPAGAIECKRRAVGVERVGARWRVTTDGGAVAADHVILACEAHAAARLMRYGDPSLAHLLDGIDYASAATVSVGFRRADVPHALDGFGLVVPRTERRALLALTFSSVKYPRRAPAGHVLMRGFVGGALDPGILDADDATLLERVRGELRDALGVTAEPVVARVSRSPRSMPQYRVGHLARVDAIEARLATLRGVALAGSAYRGVGIADCVKSGETAAEAAFGALGCAAGGA